MTNNEKIRLQYGIELEDKVCFNCTNMRWFVALGAGVRCSITSKQVPGLAQTCKHFEVKNNDIEH